MGCCGGFGAGGSEGGDGGHEDEESASSLEMPRSSIGGGVRLAAIDCGGALDTADIAERYNEGVGYDGRRSARLANAGLQMSLGERKKGVECNMSIPMPIPPIPEPIP